jgi:hypothetical protein
MEDDIQTFSLACILSVGNEYAYRKGDKKFLDSVTLAGAVASLTLHMLFLFFVRCLDLSVCTILAVILRFIYLFFLHLPKCFSVAVELLCCIRKAVCSAGKLIALTYFCCFLLYSKSIECYHCRAGRGLKVLGHFILALFFMIYMFVSKDEFIQEVPVTKSLFPFSHRLTIRERRRSETLAILNCG